MPSAARSVSPALWLTGLSTRLGPSTTRLAGPALWLDGLSVWLAFPGARLDVPTAPINHLSARLNRPAAPVNPTAARFFAKNAPKLAKTTPFPRPATPTAQIETVAPCRTILVLTRHLTPTLSPNSVGGEGGNARRRQRKTATGLAGRPSANQQLPQRFSLSRRTGEGQGEGISISP